MTTTLKLTAAEIEALRHKLEDARYEFRDLNYAHFQARGEQVVVSAYRSGKVVVQGNGAEAFLERYAGLAPAFEKAGREDPPGKRAVNGPVAGSDESGKGDYFGPMVVAAVLVLPEQAEALARAGTRDCKTMSESAVMRTAVAIRQLCTHKVLSLPPPEYNERWGAVGNVAIVLSDMHAEALAAVVPDAEALVVIDQFTTEQRLHKALGEHGVKNPTEIRHRAEDNVAVAAASVLARAEFLIQLKELGNEYGTNLPKGAGPAVDGCAKRLYTDFGMDALRALAKTHFRTTEKVTGHLF